MTNEIKLVTKQLNSTVVNMKGLLISSNCSRDPPLFVVLTFVILRISVTMQLLQISSRTQLNTHTCYKFLAQVLDGCIKQKRGKDLAQKRQTQVQ